jgi:hypothetical protein
VTIAAGLICSDGIVIAADTQATGHIKTDVHKYQYARTQTWIGAVMGAGDGDYADMCQQKIIERFAPAMTSPMPSREDVEDYALTLFDRHFAPLAHYPAAERPVAEMLIAIQPTDPHGYPWMATWHDTAFVQRHPYAFVGIGAQMASHIYDSFRGAAPHWHPMRQAVGIAIYILSQIKAVVHDCGGQTELHMLGDDGHAYYLSPERIAEREQKYKHFDRQVMVNLAKAIMEDCKRDTELADQLETVSNDGEGAAISEP